MFNVGDKVVVSMPCSSWNGLTGVVSDVLSGIVYLSRCNQVERGIVVTFSEKDWDSAVPGYRDELGFTLGFPSKYLIHAPVSE